MAKILMIAALWCAQESHQSVWDSKTGWNKTGMQECRERVLNCFTNPHPVRDLYPKLYRCIKGLTINKIRGHK